jgi:hypothetical protein
LRPATATANKALRPVRFAASEAGGAQHPAPRAKPRTFAGVGERPDEGPYRIIAQTRPPDPERGDHGEVAEGTYTVAGNVVRVEDTEGRSLGGQVLRPTDDPRVVARAILRTTKSPEPFWNPIPYTTH